MKPLVIELFCGLGGWTKGFLAEGYRAVGFDIERHQYVVPDQIDNGDGHKNTKPVEKRGWTQGCAISLGMEGAGKRPSTRLLEYPAQLVLQDVLTLHGSQFRDAAAIVASPPCQKYSYMAMPFSRGKALAAKYREERGDLNVLFDACFRLQREASEAATLAYGCATCGVYHPATKLDGCEFTPRRIPLVVENVKGAQPWVGRAKWHYGSYYLWGDVPALMPITLKRRMKCRVDCSPLRFDERIAATAEYAHAMHFRIPKGRAAVKLQTAGNGLEYGGDFGTGNSKSSARKAASAMIAEIPFDLANWIAKIFKP